MRVPHIFAGAGLIMIAMAATSCSSGSSTAATSGTATGTSGAASAKTIDVCAALPAAAASRITGTTFTTAKSSSTQGVVFNCEYEGPDSALLQVSVDTRGGKDALGAIVSSLQAVGYPPTSVSGVGDEAFSEPDPKGNAGAVGASSIATYGAVFGTTFISVGGLTYVTADQGKQIVEQLHSKI